MKLRNKILAIAVAAVAGVNVYLANDVMDQQNNLSLLTVENIAEAGDVVPMGDCTHNSVEVWGKGNKTWATIDCDGHGVVGYCDGDADHWCEYTYGCITFSGGWEGYFVVCSTF